MPTTSLSLITLEDAAAAARLLRGLPVFLRRPIGPDEARAILQQRLKQREARFLAVARGTIYDYAESPYRHLLRHVGCEYGDLERLVGHEGVEGALRELLRRGVYLTVDEFKGRRAVVRGSASFAVDPDRLANPGVARHLPARSSGSRGGGTAVLLDLAFVRDSAVNLRLLLDAWGGADWRKATWETPGGGIFRLLKMAAFGAPPVRWFSQVAPGAPGLPPRYRWGARVLRWGSLLAGQPMPLPRFVPLEDPLPIARWMTEVLRSGATPFLYAFASSAVRLCRAAEQAGLDLRGARIVAIGEPSTEARMATIRRVGAEVLPRYGTIEIGPVGYGCLAGEAADDVHLLHDLHALVQPASGEPPGLPPGALLISTLGPSAPFVMLNVSMGDLGVMRERDCGCPLAALGWATHLHTIRSFEKLTAGGTTFFDTDIIRVLEEVLRRRFGGAPTDYQLLESETAEGQPTVRLLVHPALGPVDADAVAEVFLQAIGGGSGREGVGELVWRGAGLLTVERRPPVATGSGKILHLHLERPSRPPPAGG